MNEKQKIRVVMPDATEPQLLPVRIAFIRPASEIKQNGETFTVDWQLDGTGAVPEKKLPGWRQLPATSQTYGRGRSTASIVPSRNNGNK